MGYWAVLVGHKALLVSYWALLLSHWAPLLSDWTLLLCHCWTLYTPVTTSNFQWLSTVGPQRPYYWPRGSHCWATEHYLWASGPYARPMGDPAVSPPSGLAVGPSGPIAHQ